MVSTATAARTEQKLVTGKINGQDVTVPAGTTILEASRLAGIEVPNLCYQPLMRPWGSCRICTVQVLGRRGGLIESCATPLGEGMEVLTHSPECIDARQFILQTYLIDHALDCPTCDKSGECYLQDNTYLHNVNANPYRRPKLAQPYEHFSATIDYKWDRCIMCNRCTRVCDEMIGVTAIETASRSLEATITPAFGMDLSDTSCTNCGMCIAVCPVGALTDRHFGHHPWELDTTETICGFCDVGCTINVETNRGLVRRVTHLWERGVNHGYTCERGKWGWEQVQHPDRLLYPRVKDHGNVFETTWDEAIDRTAEELAHHQGDKFALLVSPDSTNESAYALQLFGRAVMGSNNVDRTLTPAQAAVEGAVRQGLGRDAVNTNNMQELFTDVRCALVVGPSIGRTEPVASYWFYHARLYREAKMIVISQEDYPLGRRGDLWLRPRPGTMATLLNGIARQIVDLDLVDPTLATSASFAEWRTSLAAFDLDRVAEETGVPAEKIAQAATLYATGGAGTGRGRPDGGFPPSLIYQTAAHADPGPTGDGDPAAIAAACNNLAILTGNLGRAGGGVASPRGPANYQGVTDMGAVPYAYPGGGALADTAVRGRFESAWLPRWAERATTQNGFLPVRRLSAQPGLSLAELPDAIESGRIEAMVVDGTIAGRETVVNDALYRALGKLKLLVVLDTYPSPLVDLAHVALPKAMFLEEDGTFTSFDRTVQRLRQTVAPMGEAKPAWEIVSLLAQRMGFGLESRHPSQIGGEIAQLLPGYGGVTYARLERGSLSTPVTHFLDNGAPILVPGPDGVASLSPQLIPA